MIATFVGVFAASWTQVQILAELIIEAAEALKVLKIFTWAATLVATFFIMALIAIFMSIASFPGMKANTSSYVSNTEIRMRILKEA